MLGEPERLRGQARYYHDLGIIVPPFPKSSEEYKQVVHEIEGRRFEKEIKNLQSLPLAHLLTLANEYYRQ